MLSTLINGCTIATVSAQSQNQEGSNRYSYRSLFSQSPASSALWGGTSCGNSALWGRSALWGSNRFINGSRALWRSSAFWGRSGTQAQSALWGSQSIRASSFTSNSNALSATSSNVVLIDGDIEK